MITLVFCNSDDAETAFEEYFSEPSETTRATLDRQAGTITVDRYAIGETHLDIPDGLIAIII
jgi:hypothetical protein